MKEAVQSKNSAIARFFFPYSLNVGLYHRDISRNCHFVTSDTLAWLASLTIQIQLNLFMQIVIVVTEFANADRIIFFFFFTYPVKNVLFWPSDWSLHLPTTWSLLAGITTMLHVGQEKSQKREALSVFQWNELRFMSRPKLVCSRIATIGIGPRFSE